MCKSAIKRDAAITVGWSLHLDKRDECVAYLLPLNFAEVATTYCFFGLQHANMQHASAITSSSVTDTDLRSHPCLKEWWVQEIILIPVTFLDGSAVLLYSQFRVRICWTLNKIFVTVIAGSSSLE